MLINNRIAFYSRHNSFIDIYNVLPEKCSYKKIKFCLINKKLDIERPHRKGKKSPSVVIPIHPELLPVMEQTIQGKTPEAYVFINPRAQRPYSQHALQRIWDNVRKKINLDKSFRLYDATRHSLASNLVNQNVPISKISRLLGHTNTRTTEKYAHVDIQSLRKDIEKVSIIKMPARKEKVKTPVEGEGK